MVSVARCSLAAFALGNVYAVTWAPHDVELGKLKESVTSSEAFQAKVAATCKSEGVVGGKSKAVEECSQKVSDRLFCQLLQRSKVAAHQEAALHCAPGTDAASPALQVPTQQFVQTGGWPFGGAEPIHSEVTAEYDHFGVQEHSVADMRAEITSSELFRSKVQMMCADASTEEKKQCETAQAGRLWCAMIARNKPKMNLLPDPDKDGETCKEINQQKGADRFLAATWQIGVTGAIGYAGVVNSDGQEMSRDPIDGGSWDILKKKGDNQVLLWHAVTENDVFKKHVEKICIDTFKAHGKNLEPCKKAATRRYFCQLLEKKDPEKAAANCGGSNKKSLLQKSSERRYTEVLASVNAETWAPHDVELGKLKESVTSSEAFQAKVAATCKSEGVVGGKSKAVEECSQKLTDRLFCQLLQRSKVSAHQEAALHCAPGTDAASPALQVPMQQ